MYFLYIFLSTVRLNLQWLTYIKLCFLKINCLLENETTTWIFLKMMMGNDFSIHNTRKDTEKIILGFLAAIPVSNSRFSLKIPFKTGITRGNLRSFECGYLNFIQREMLWSTQANFKTFSEIDDLKFFKIFNMNILKYLTKVDKSFKIILVGVHFMKYNSLQTLSNFKVSCFKNSHFLKYESWFFSKVGMLTVIEFSNEVLLAFKLPWFFLSLHKKWSFWLSISSVNMTKSAVSCGFGYIYWRNP